MVVHLFLNNNKALDFLPINSIKNGGITAAQDEKTPLWAKTTIYGSLGYFISPIDAIPDITPIAGYSDDLGVLVLALSTVATYINDDVKNAASKKMIDWFGR